MTTERDFDRLARAWLELGPDEAPDRVIAAVLQASQTVPQARRGARWPFRRSFHMTRLPILAVVVAALIAVIGAVAVAGGFGPSSTSRSSPVPSAAAAAPTVVQASDVPIALQQTWIGPKRTIAGVTPSARFRFKVGPSSLDFQDDAYIAYLASAANAVGTDGLVVTSSFSTDGCTAGDVGHYRWSLSPGSKHLTLTATDDACASRLAALAGTWSRVLCTNAEDGCFGDLEAGTVPTQYFAPTLPLAATWTPDWGALTYTVPDGWSNSADWPDEYTITPTTSYADDGPDGPLDGRIDEIDLYRLPGAAIQRSDCANQSDESVAPTVDGLIAHIRGLKGLTSSAPKPITIAGRSGQYLDLTIAPGWKGTCPDLGGTPTVNYLVRQQADGNSYGVWLTGAEQHRLILLDLGGGQVMAIVAVTSDPARFQPLAAEAMSIASSFTFK